MNSFSDFRKKFPTLRVASFFSSDHRPHTDFNLISVIPYCREASLKCSEDHTRLRRSSPVSQKYFLAYWMRKPFYVIRLFLGTDFRIFINKFFSIFERLLEPQAGADLTRSRLVSYIRRIYRSSIKPREIWFTPIVL